jgi:transcription elongation factor Elf1
MEYINIRSFDNYIPAHIASGRLEEEGINCWLKDENTVTIDPILTNAIGGIKLMVDARQAERAADILRKLESEHRKLTPCPRCQSQNIDYVSTPRKASNWFSALWGFLTLSYAMPVEKVFHCFDCGHEYVAEENRDATKE